MKQHILNALKAKFLRVSDSIEAFSDYRRMTFLGESFFSWLIR